MAKPPSSQGSQDAATAPDKLQRSFGRRVSLSWLALIAERALEALLWPFVVVCAFLVFSLLGGWGLLAPMAHRILLGLFAIALLVSLLPLWRIAVPTRGEALRRLERDSGIKHRPASSYEDTLDVKPETATEQLWFLHRSRLGRLIAKLKPSWPAPRADRNDPFAIRAALLLALIAAFFAAGSDTGTRLLAAFSPGTTAPTQIVRLDAWITPPVYTAIAPIVLADGTEPVGKGLETFRAMSVPVRSQLIVRTHAPDGEAVTLTLAAGEDGNGAVTKTIDPKTGGTDGLVEFNAALIEPVTADLRISGNIVAQWQFSMIEDTPPRIALRSPPVSSPRGQLRIEYGALDDYGVASAEARFALADDEKAHPQSRGQIGNGSPAEDEDLADLAEVEPLFGPPVMKFQLPRSNAKKSEGHATQDLTAHPWAGLKVLMTLQARDQAEQVGESAPYPLVLPARVFREPLARAVIEQRQLLVRDPNASPRVARALEALTIGDEKVIDDRLVYLSLRNTYWRLVNDNSREAIKSVVDQLWETALRIEDGDLPDAARDLKTAQDALMKALQENASAEEIQQRIAELREALGRYLQALAAQQNDQGNMAGESPQDGEEYVSGQDLDQMLEDIKNLAEAGSTDMAERMLSELNDILERLEANKAPQNENQQRAEKALQDVDDMISEQQRLMDETFNEERKRRQGQSGGQNPRFDMNPPGGPMGLGNSMSPMMDQTPKSGQTGARAQGRSGRQGDAPGGGKDQLGQQQPPQGAEGSLQERQQALRQKLQKLIERMRQDGGNAPEQFPGAEEAMKQAEDAMGAPNFELATQSQSLALERMRDGARSMAQQMMESGEMQAGKGPGFDGRDPLGRPDRSNRPDLGLSVQVPDEIDIQKAREVLDELRRRIGDPARPALELDYLERLIRSF